MHFCAIFDASVVQQLPEPNRLASTFSLEMHSNSQVWEVRG